MILKVEGEARDFIPIALFRAEHGLPSTFGTATFQPKTWEGLASLDGASLVLQALRQQMLEHLPPSATYVELPKHIGQLTATFEQQLLAINGEVGLKPQEIDFAVNGLEAVLSAFMYEAIRTHATHLTPPTFEAVYQHWLQYSVHLDGSEYRYAHQGEVWHIRLIHHAYGRVGMRVIRPHQIAYIEDKALACPAEGYMASLLRALVTRLGEALSRSL